jgi:glycosyltransferase involved in cell wall biosynthesis/peptidoglycan/xylan/chitin deacetylase (PgdA/CDA1 family)
MLDPKESIRAETDSWTRIPLRIGFLMDHPSPHMTALLEAIASRSDCTIEILYCGKTAPERNWGSNAGSVPHEFLRGFTGPLGIRFNPGIFRELNRMRVDVWVVNTIYSSITTLMAAWRLHGIGKPWVFMNEPIRPRSRPFSNFKEMPIRFVLGRADGIVATGKAAVEMYRARLRKDCPCASVPYFIDLSEFSNLSPAAASEREDLHFLTSCQMIQRKGLDCLLQACEKLPKTGWRLTLAGDGPLRQELEYGFSDLISRGRVRFIGAIPYQNRWNTFAGRHVFVFPSRWDGWGMVVPEALAAGLPVISSDQVMSAHEFIKDGENGFIVPAGDPDALAGKMQWFIQNASSCSRMSRNARASVENYKPESGAAVLVQFLRQFGAGVHQEQGSESIPLNPEQTTWQVLTAPEKRLESAKLRMRAFAKDIVIRADVAARRPRKAGGHLILGYHLVLKEDRCNFENQIKFFKDHFRLCSISDLLNAAASGKQEEFGLAITFDDGFRLLTQHCLEILAKYGIKAGFFVPAAFVASGLARNGKASNFSKRAFYYRYPLEPMSPEDLKNLVDLGHEIGSHGTFHTSIHSLAPDSAQKELAASRSMIAGWTGVAPNGFCFPYGGCSSSLGNPADWLRDAGFTYGLTLVRGSVNQKTNRFALPRHHVEGNWPIHHLQHFLLA